jgi:hypothetical protein
MAISIVERKRANGSVVYTAQVRIYEKRAVIHNESESFERRKAARDWAKRRAEELAKPGALDKVAAKDPTLAEVIDTYIDSLEKDIGKTKLR